uniref:Uncharacterized protein n=1 Tax=Glossina pallidipes TaxID=7398 RepID=A0A1A9ZRP8_GLOPL
MANAPRNPNRCHQHLTNLYAISFGGEAVKFGTEKGLECFLMNIPTRRQESNKYEECNESKSRDESEEERILCGIVTGVKKEIPLLNGSVQLTLVEFTQQQLCDFMFYIFMEVFKNLEKGY